MGRLLDAIGHAYRELGLDLAAGRDVGHEQLVTAPIIEPTSMEDAVRVLAEAGVRSLDVQSAAGTPTRTTMRYDRAPKNLDRHSNYIPVAYMASGT